MKKIFTTTLFAFSVIFTFSQGVNFQGVARSANGTILASTNIGLRLSIISKNVDATPEYVETKTVATNAQGIFSVVVGDASSTAVIGNFKNIAWSDGIKFLKVEMDPAAGTNFINMGTTQLQYVPYTFYSLGVDATGVKGVLPVKAGGTGVSNLDSLKAALKITNIDTISLSNRINTLNSIIRQDSLFNLKVGIGSLQSIKSGTGNIGIGDSTLKYIETGSENTAIGTGSMLNTTTGNFNVAVGVRALGLNTSGYRNVAVGNTTLVQNTTGYDNVAVGPLVMQRNTTGRGNVAVGRRALWRNSIGNNNLAIGDSTLMNIEGENNTAIGAYAGLKSETGSNNIFIGSKAAAGIAFKNVNDKLVIDNDSTNSPLIYGEFDSNKLTINGELTATSFKIPNGTSSQYLKADGTVSTSVTSGVPYSGASQAVDLGAYDMKVNGLTVGVGSSTSTNTSNTALGNETLLNNTTGFSNTAVGLNSMKFNTVGNSNVAYGIYSLHSNTSGKFNTAVGDSSLYSNTTGYANVGVGLQTLATSTTSIANVALGNYALNNNTTGSYNTAIGYKTLFSNTTESNLTAIGYYALAANTSGRGNTGIGYEAMPNNNIGSYNTANGSFVLHMNTSGSENTASGYSALQSNTSGSYNTANGVESLGSNTIGLSNTSIGFYSLNSNTTGNDNTAIGTRSLSSNEVGNGNTAIGKYAGYNNKGSNNIFIGEAAIGSDINISNEITLGNSSNSVIRSAVSTITSLSDARDKKNISDLTVGLNFINSLKPRVFNWDKREWYSDGFSDGSKIDKEFTSGFIAQELDEAQVKFNADWLKLVYKSNPNKWEATYGNLLPVVVKSIQELSNENLYLKEKNKELEIKLSKIEKLLQSLIEEHK